MTPKRLHPECLQCLTGKQLPDFLENQPLEKQLQYIQTLLKLLSEVPDTYAGPVIMHDIHKLRKDMFGYSQDFTEIKKQYNALMMIREAEAADAIANAEDPLLKAVQYSLIGNYIDFGSHHSVKDDELDDMFKNASSITLKTTVFERFRTDVLNARRILLLTDNCGEIVLDKLLIQAIQKLNPTSEVIVMVRGEDVQNDATLADAQQVGMTSIAKVIGNGNGIAGTWEPALSAEAIQALDTADMIIAQGQANVETLCQCGKNIYYLFLCKCQMFAHRFNVPRLTGMLVHDSEC